MRRRGATSRRLAAALLTTLAVGCSPAPTAPPFDLDGPASLLPVPPLVGRPTANTVSLAVVTGDEPLRLELTLDPPARGSSHHFELAANQATDLEIGGLEPGTVYHYTLEAGSAPDGENRQEVAHGRFVTQREPGASFSFALFSDPHLPVPAPEWLDPASANLFALETADYLIARLDIGTTIRQVLSSIQRREVDFIVCLGDMLHFYRGFNDPFPNAEIADFAYLDLRRHLSRAGAEAAFYAVIGNWDGESGWQPERLQQHARQARMRYLPNPGADTYRYGGSPNEDYYAWTWGDVLLVALNVMTHTPTAHTLSVDDDGTADDWTLGSEQLSWLQATLEASSETFKILLIHHPVGGNGGDDGNSAYGRGGGRAATIGEQRTVHRLMRQHGVQILFHGHDHVFTDVIVDGIHYTLPGSAGAPWKFSGEETGYESFDERSGFALVHVTPSQLEVELLDINGEAFRAFSVHHLGR